MFKFLFFLLYLLPGSTQPPALQANDCTCPQVSNLHKSGQASGSITMSWNGETLSSGYTLKYVRQSDGYASPEFATTGTSYTFSGLTAGNYVFYVATICGDEKSSFIGVEDLVEN